MKMADNCALYRCEKHEEDGIKWKDEYCDGLDEPICKCKVICPFYKSKNKWRAVTVRKQTQYVRIE